MKRVLVTFSECCIGHVFKLLVVASYLFAIDRTEWYATFNGALEL